MKYNISKAATLGIIAGIIWASPASFHTLIGVGVGSAGVFVWEIICGFEARAALAKMAMDQRRQRIMRPGRRL